MEIKKSNFLEDRFKLSSFILKIYNVNADNRRHASVSSVRTGVKTHLTANQKRGYIEKYVNIIDALGSAHVKFDVSSKSIFCRSIRQARSNRTAESTQIQKCRSYIDSYVELYMCRT